MSSEGFVPGRVSVPPPPGSESAGPPLTELVAAVAETAAELRRTQLLLRREWSLYRELATDVTASNAVTLSTPRVAQGFEVELERLSLSVGGNSAAATVAVYVAGVDEARLVDVISALTGSTPSRVVRPYLPPLRLLGGEFLSIVIASAAGGTNQVYARVEGRKREP